MAYAGRLPAWRQVGRAILNFLRVEDDDVGRHAGGQRAAVGQSQALGHATRHLGDGGGHVQVSGVPHQPPQHTHAGAEVARVRLAAPLVERYCRAVRPHERMAAGQEGAHVFLGAVEQHHHDAVATFAAQLQHETRRAFAGVSGRGLQRLAFQRAQHTVGARQYHAVPQPGDAVGRPALRQVGLGLGHHLFVGQAFAHGRHAAFLHPGRQILRERGAGRVVRVDVERGVHTVGHGGLETCGPQAGAAPFRRCVDGGVGVLHPRARAAPQVQGFVERAVAVVVAIDSLVACMRRIEPATPGQCFAQRNKLLGRRVTRGHISQPGAEAEGALVQHLAQQGLHGGHLFGTGRAAVHTHGRDTQSAVPDQRRDVQGNAAALGQLAVTLHIGPRQRQRVVAYAGQQVQVQLHVGGIDGKGGETAVAGDLGRHALGHLALAAAVQYQAHVGVGVDVDEPRAHHLVRRVDHAGGLHECAVAHQRNLLAPHRHVRQTRWRASAVKHQSTSNKQVSFHARKASFRTTW